ncbi:MAG: MotA/TolQ/ExbB proton channel family protein [Vicinamibacterales bacterium]
MLALQMPDVAPEAGTDLISADLIGIVTRSTPINQAVLVILVAFSIASWAVILIKYLSFRTAARESDTFLGAFRKGGFTEAQGACDASKASPLVGLFQAGYAEMSAQFRLTGAAAPGARPQLKSLEAVDRALLRAAASEISRLERKLTFLATTASVTPFVGLFGTVVGIMIAFQRIGTTGSTNLAVVGPGISEALVATAMGLFAAIPAVLAYNQFTHRVKEFSAAMDDFAMEFLNIVERNFT